MIINHTGIPFMWKGEGEECRIATRWAFKIEYSREMNVKIL